jgi:5-methylcytosine-specific restriction endonuclease McrA
MKKPCKKCGLESTGPRCGPCRKAWRSAHYQANKERWVGYNAKRMAEHGTAVRAYRKAKKQTPSYKAKTAEYNARYRREHPNYMREWAQSNRDKTRATTSRHRVRKANGFGFHTEAEWRSIVKSQKGRCAHCNEAKPLEQDHKIPVSRGGSDMAVNIQGLCRTCNVRKSAKIPVGTQLSVFDRVAVAA